MTEFVDTQLTRARMMDTTCVLLIEDDELTRARLECIVEAAGYGVFSVSNAAEARKALQAVTFPMVIIDRMLPDADGVMLCKEVRKLSEPNQIFVTLLSARDAREDIAAGMAAGADDYLSKRAGDAQLIDRLHGSIRKIRLEMK